MEMQSHPAPSGYGGLSLRFVVVFFPTFFEYLLAELFPVLGALGLAVVLAEVLVPGVVGHPLSTDETMDASVHFFTTDRAVLHLKAGRVGHRPVMFKPFGRLRVPASVLERFYFAFVAFLHLVYVLGHDICIMHFSLNS